MTKLRDTEDDYRLGHLTADDKLDGVRISNRPHLRQKDEPYRIGSLVDKKMEEAEDAGGIADQNDQKVRNDAANNLSQMLHKAVTARVNGKEINLKFITGEGHKGIGDHIKYMIDLESRYLSALINGQSADTPALQKIKEQLKAAENKLNRMLQTDDVWPFK